MEFQEIEKESILIPDYRTIIENEPHDHKIIVDTNGNFRWKANPDVRLLANTLGLNEIISNFHSKDIYKNSEPYRKLYRDIGYSLLGYWEIFYWEANNPNTDEYVFDPEFYRGEI